MCSGMCVCECQIIDGGRTKCNHILHATTLRLQHIHTAQTTVLGHKKVAQEKCGTFPSQEYVRQGYHMRHMIRIHLLQFQTGADQLEHFQCIYPPCKICCLGHGWFSSLETSFCTH